MATTSTISPRPVAPAPAAASRGATPAPDAAPQATAEPRWTLARPSRSEQRRTAETPPSCEPRLSAGWRRIERAALPAPSLADPRPSAVARLARDLRTARRIPLRQLAARARFRVLAQVYAARPAWPIARARRLARETAAAHPLPRLARELLAPGWSEAEASESLVRRCDALEQGEHTLLGRTADFSAGVRWRDAAASPLWLFQLHELRCVRDLALAGRFAAVRGLVADWAAVFGERWDAVAWHPYPTSLRTAHLCFAAGLAGGFEELGATTAELVATHAAFVLAHEERDLRGNHLLENAFALLVVARHLEGPLASSCDVRGRAILAAELPEQILADGAHFELSPMYHAIVLHRLLVLAELLGRDDPLVCESIAPAVARMASFLEGVLAPDGDIPLLGDSARGSAPPPRALLRLARAGAAAAACGTGEVAAASGEPPLPGSRPDATPAASPRLALASTARARRIAVCAHPASGIHVLASDRFWCLFDAGRVCPDALPGHGQSDVLAIEVWLDGERFVIDPGVHEYSGAWRAWGRSSRAHSALTVDDRDNDEVYGSFRVGARSEVLAVRATHDGVSATVRAASGATLRRSVRLQGTRGERLQVDDEVIAPAGSAVASRLHVAPGVTAAMEVLGHRCVRLRAPGGATLSVRSREAIDAEAGVASLAFGDLAETVLLVQRGRRDAARPGGAVRLSWVLDAEGMR